MGAVAAVSRSPRAKDPASASIVLGSITHVASILKTSQVGGNGRVPAALAAQDAQSLSPLRTLRFSPANASVTLSATILKSAVPDREQSTAPSVVRSLKL